MSHPYTSKALWNMTQAVEAKLRQERALLWRARNLHKQFLGDSNWIPCGSVETEADRWVFEPKVPDAQSVNRYHGGHRGSPAATSAAQKEGNQELSGAGTKEPEVTREEQVNQTTEDDTPMPDVQNTEQGDGNQDEGPAQKPKSEDADTAVGDVLPHPDKDPDQANGDNTEKPQNEQIQPADTEGTRSGQPEQGDEQINAAEQTAKTDPEHASETQTEEPEKDTEMQDTSSPEPPRRMTTRARANAENPEDDSPANHSPTLSSDTLTSTLLGPHPLFLVPDSIRPGPNFGLPPNEAEDTRRLLWSYVQKQEETVRGFEHMLDSLLRACRMKDDVFEWCKAEGHLGEMSDGEDWYDREKWGLAEGEELKKGADEDDIETVDDTTRATGKRGRGRRA